MPKASDKTSSAFIKLLFIGASGAGKTGALTSLAEAGYKLRIIDLDSGLEALFNLIEHKDPKLLESVEYETFRDRVKMTAQGPRLKGAPKAYANTLAALEKWPEDGSDPAEWGEDYVLVIDSLTNVGRAAFQWAKAVNPTTKDPRQWYSAAQGLVEDLIANLTDEEFKCNVIVISHVELFEGPDGLRKGYTSAIGKALGPKLPRFFNTLLLSETKGSGSKVQRKIKTVPTALIDVKNPAPWKIDDEYDVADGLAKIFAKLKNG